MTIVEIKILDEEENKLYKIKEVIATDLLVEGIKKGFIKNVIDVMRDEIIDTILEEK